MRFEMKERTPAQTSSKFGRLEGAKEGEELNTPHRGSPSAPATHHCQKLHSHHSSSVFMEANAVLYQPSTCDLAGLCHAGFPFHPFRLQWLPPGPVLSPPCGPRVSSGREHSKSWGPGEDVPSCLLQAPLEQHHSSCLMPWLAPSLTKTEYKKVQPCEVLSTAKPHVIKRIFSTFS